MLTESICDYLWRWQSMQEARIQVSHLLHGEHAHAYHHMNWLIDAHDKHEVQYQLIMGSQVPISWEPYPALETSGPMQIMLVMRVRVDACLTWWLAACVSLAKTKWETSCTYFRSSHSEEGGVCCWFCGSSKVHETVLIRSCDLLRLTLQIEITASSFNSGTPTSIVKWRSSRACLYPRHSRLWLHLSTSR